MSALPLSDDFQRSIVKKDLLKLTVSSVKADTQFVSNAVVTLIGDASASSYYRLGIGVHSIVQTLGEISLFIEGVLRGESTAAGMQAKNHAGTARLRQHDVFQLAVLLHEAYCSQAVGFTSWTTDSLAVFKRDFTAWDAPLPIHKVEDSATHSPVKLLAAVHMCQDILKEMDS
jgi:hypothetical protein